MLAWKLIPVVPQVLICHGQVGGPHAGRVLWERGEGVVRTRSRVARHTGHRASRSAGSSGVLGWPPSFNVRASWGLLEDSGRGLGRLHVC